MSSNLQIANRALQKAGVAKRLATFEDDNQKGRAIRTCYETLKRAELQMNAWTFSIRRVQIAAETDTPAFDYLYQYQLPADFLKMAPLRPKTSMFLDDHEIEGRKLLTNNPGPLNLRIVSSDADEEQFHALFVEGFASRIAYEVTEELTQSAAKKDSLATDYTKFMSDARLVNAIEKGFTKPRIDDYEAVRHGGTRFAPWFRGA